MSAGKSPPWPDDGLTTLVLTLSRYIAQLLPLFSSAGQLTIESAASRLVSAT
jgi:hypothetical protein